MSAGPTTATPNLLDRVAEPLPQIRPASESIPQSIQPMPKPLKSPQPKSDTMAKPADAGKVKALENALAIIQKNYGEGAVMKLGQSARMNVETISTQCLSLDLALGGGYAKGRVIEIYGPESSGKTTLTLHAVAEVQKQGGTAAFIDAEHAFDPEYAKKIGVNLDNLLISQPDNGEQALEIAETLVRSGAVDLIVIDSVAALTPQAEIEGDMGASLPGLQARLMSQALRKITAIASKAGTTIIFLNQIRMKIGVMFGNPETTTGGNALKFYASQRLDIRRTGKVEVGTGDAKTAIGNETRVKVVKNKVAPPFRQAEFEIRFNHGIDRASDLILTGTKLGVIAKAGAFLTVGEQKFQGMEKARQALLDDPQLFADIESRVRTAAKNIDITTGEMKAEVPAPGAEAEE